MRWRSLRRTNERTALKVVTALATLAVTQSAWAAPKYVRLSYTDNTATTMSVTWNTDATADTEVRYGKSSGSLTSSSKGTSFQANGSLGQIHEVTLKGLEPATEYFYVAGSDADGFSKEQSFRTGPVPTEKCGAFKFAYLGDNRPDPIFGGGENWPEILGQSAAHKPAFTLNGGDLVIEGDQLDQWHDFLNWTQASAGHTPFLPCIGNHDTGPGEGDGANFNQIFALPRSTGTKGSGTEDYYYFTYGNAIFVALSTEGFNGGTPAFSDQAAWLDEVLTQHPALWKIVFYHKPSYTHEAVFEISHGPNEVGQNAPWVAIFDKHHVDIVFTSHNHWYERFEPSACATQGKAGSAQACSVGAASYDKGTVYIVSGGAGAFTIPALLCGSESGRAECSGSHHYIIVDINNETLKLETWGAAPQDNQIIDTLTIQKGAVSCVEPPDAGPDADASGSGGSGGSPPDASQPEAAIPADGSPPKDSAGTKDAAIGTEAAGVDGSPPADSGSPGATTPEAGDSGGCGCRSAKHPSAYSGAVLAAIAAVSLGRRRRRPGREGRS